jgi:transcriptional regulator with XRE-family HTH domain
VRLFQTITALFKGHSGDDPGGAIPGSGDHPAPAAWIDLDDGAVERLAAAVRASGAHPDRVAVRAKLQPDDLDEILAGSRRQLPPPVLHDLARALGTDPGWLLSGKAGDGPTIGARVRGLRGERRLSQRTLVHHMREIDPDHAITVGTLQRIERGETRRPDDTTLVAMGKVLGVTREFLLLGHENEPPDQTPETARRATSFPPAWRWAAGGVAVAAAVFLFSRFATTPDAPLAVVTVNDNHALEVRAGKRVRWAHAYQGHILHHQQLNWDGAPVVMVALDESGPIDAGAFAVYDAVDGSPILEDLPDPSDALERMRVYGDRGRDMRPMFRRYPRQDPIDLFADIDGDDQPELIVPFQECTREDGGMLRVYNRRGEAIGSYYFDGEIDYHEVDDIDHDGKDEIVVSGTGRNLDHRGFTLAVLDDTHLSGVSPDVAEDPACQSKEPALASVRLPAFDDEFMKLLGGTRVHAWEIKVLPDTANALFMVSASPDMDRPVILYFDGAMHVVRVEISDALLAATDAWPAESRQRFRDGYLQGWAAAAEHFGAERVDQ